MFETEDGQVSRAVLNADLEESLQVYCLLLLKEVRGTVDGGTAVHACFGCVNSRHQAGQAVGFILAILSKR